MLVKGVVVATAFSKIYNINRLILFSSPGCQFGKRLHNWINGEITTPFNKVFGVESLKDSVLPWNNGNTNYLCKKNDGIKYYLNSLGIKYSNIQMINPFNKYIINNNTQIILLNTPFINGNLAHLSTCYDNIFTIHIMDKLWLNTIINE